MSLDEIVVGWNCCWMKVSWLKVSLDESVKIGWKCFGWKCHWMKSCLDESVIGWNRVWMKVSLDEIDFGWKCILPFGDQPTPRDPAGLCGCLPQELGVSHIVPKQFGQHLRNPGLGASSPSFSWNSGASLDLPRHRVRSATAPPFAAEPRPNGVVVMGPLECAPWDVEKLLLPRTISSLLLPSNFLLCAETPEHFWIATIVLNQTLLGSPNESSVALIWCSTSGTFDKRSAFSNATWRTCNSSVSSSPKTAIDALILDILSVATARISCGGTLTRTLAMGTFCAFGWEDGPPVWRCCCWPAFGHFWWRSRPPQDLHPFGAWNLPSIAWHSARMPFSRTVWRKVKQDTNTRTCLSAWATEVRTQMA